MRDKAQLNKLLAGEETHDNTIRVCIDVATSKWNMLPPIGVLTTSIAVSGTDANGVTVRTITIPSNMDGVFMEGVILEILKSVLLLKSRNIMSYSDGGLQVDEDSRSFQADLQMIQLLSNEYQTLLRGYKTSYNIASIMGTSGGIGSDYSLLGNSWLFS